MENLGQVPFSLEDADTESQRMIHLALGQNWILERIAMGRPLGETMEMLLRFLEKDTPEMSCSILLLDADGRHLRHCAAPSLPEAYSRLIDGAPIGPCAGSCGTAAYRRERVIVTDIEIDPLWEKYRHLVRPYGLRACWSTPILNAEGKVLGTFAMYFKRPASPEVLHQRLIEVALHVAAIAIGKRQREVDHDRLTDELSSRVVELTLQRRVGQELLVDRPIGQELFESLVAVISTGWFEAGSIGVRVVYGAWDVQSPNYQESGRGIRRTFRTSRAEGLMAITPSEACASEELWGAKVSKKQQEDLLDSLLETITVYLERVHVEEALAESEERYRLINLATNDAVWDWDVRRSTLWWNDGVTVLFGYPREEISTDLAWWSERVHEEDRERASESLHRAAESLESSWVEEYRFKKKDGNYAYVQDRGYVMRDAKGIATRMIGMMQDITDRKRADSRIRELAYQEPVTGLPNRTAVQQHLTQAVVQADLSGHRLALFLLNLNCFRDINDSLGHQNGDVFLRCVAERLRAAVGGQGEVASLGGDEFAIVFPHAFDDKWIEVVTQEIHACLEAPVQVSDIPIQIDATLGIALFPEHGATSELLWQHADVALRTAKERFETHLIYHPTIDHYDPARLMLIGELRSAIESGQLVLYYQPKIDLVSGKTIGAEALVRWQHPSRGLIYPDTFIPLAERTGLINPLTSAVVLAALRQGQIFHQNGFCLDIAVNLSARNLHEPGFVTRLLRLIEAVGFPLSQLTLEVTETAIMADPVRAKAVLAELRQAGIHISMDDFGVGQSSLSYLKELPISKMKIDKSFIIDFTQSRNVAVVRSAIDLARNMGLESTAEGIEDEATYQALREFGCELGQGYFFSRPLPADRFECWLRESPFGISGADSGVIPALAKSALGVG